jgi:hypothetical protein
MSMHRSLALGTLLCLALGATASADLINGSLSLAGLEVHQNGSNLGVSTQITADGDIVVSGGIGDFGPVDLYAVFDCTPINVLSPGTGFDFVMSHSDWGIFTAQSGTIVTQTASYLDLLLTGIYSPGNQLKSELGKDLDDTAATLRISINQSGTSVSEAVTLSAVPEPTSWVLAGSGLVGMLFLRRRKARA